MIRRQNQRLNLYFYVTTKKSKLKIKVMAQQAPKFRPLRTQVRKAIVDFFNEEISAKTTKENWNDLIFQHLSERCSKANKVRLYK